MKSRLRRFCALFLTLSISAAAATWSTTGGDGDRDGDVDLLDYQAFEACFRNSGPTTPLGAEFQACIDAYDVDADNDLDMRDLASFLITFTGRRVPARIPAQYLTMDTIGIHDSGSLFYDGDCIGCHGPRVDEVALDGVTRVAHSKMIMFLTDGAFPTNEACIYCHQVDIDFLTMSAGGLRKQVDIWGAECALCHIVGGPPDTPRFYERQER